MKKIANLFFTAVIAVTIFSCSKKDDDTTTITSDEAKVSAKIDLANDDVSAIVQNQYENPDSQTLSNKSGEMSLAVCATISRVPAFGTALNVNDNVTKTIDFGAGCTLNNGNFVSGKIIITYVVPAANATSVTVNYLFDNFYHNANKIVGNKNFVFTKIAATTTIPEHWRAVMNMDLDITVNGVVYHRTGSRTTEQTAGFGQAFALHVYQVTGSWTTTPAGGVAWSSSITTPLVVKMSCMNVNKPLLVQGVITFVRNNTTATLDYGDGSCDNLAVYTIGGNSYNIIIGN